MKFKVGFDFCLGIDSERRSGGLAMLWQKELNVMISSYSKYHISAYITKGVEEERWFVTGVYGHPETSRRMETWSKLEHKQFWVTPSHGLFWEILTSC